MSSDRGQGDAGKTAGTETGHGGLGYVHVGPGRGDPGSTINLSQLSYLPVTEYASMTSSLCFEIMSSTGNISIRGFFGDLGGLDPLWVLDSVEGQDLTALGCGSE